MDKVIKTDDRIKTAAEFVREGSVAADIGTDHGYLPIYLIKNGISVFAYASDINEKPLLKSRENAIKYGVCDKISFHLSDGLDFVDRGEMKIEYPITDIVICGMGGELIADIIEKSGYPKKAGIRLILQPMTMAEKLRVYLAEAGFEIKDEKLCEAAGKIYTVICAEYDGCRREVNGADAYLGAKNIDRGGELFRAYAKSLTAKLSVKISGLERGGHDSADDQKLLDEIRRITEETEE